MFKNLLIAAVSVTFIISCSSSSKKDAAKGGADGQAKEGGAVAGQELSFSPEGSDSKSIAGLNTVNFDYDQANLTEEARKQLKTNADWIKANGTVNVQVEGHCDSRGSIEYNLALGERRAKSVKTYLVSQGVDTKRLSIISYGKEKLLDQTDSEEGHARNRRANFLPIPR